MPENKWQVLQSKYKLKTPYLKIRKDVCQTRRGKRIQYYVVEKTNTAGIIAFTPDKKIILQKQYRHPHKKWVTQIPAGHIEKGESPIRAIRRELLEETGYRVKKIIRLNKFYPACATFNNTWNVYLGFKAVKVREPNKDAAEELETFLVTLNEAMEMVKQGEIQDMDSALAIILTKQYLD
jgi:ADP-ribose pyrophosphatase